VGGGQKNRNFITAMYDASSGKKMQRWILLNEKSFCEMRQRFSQTTFTVLLPGIYGRYAMHKLCSIVVSMLCVVYDVVFTKYYNKGR